MVRGQWSVVRGPWSVVSGPWLVVSGPWLVVLPWRRMPRRAIGDSRVVQEATMEVGLFGNLHGWSRNSNLRIDEYSGRVVAEIERGTGICQDRVVCDRHTSRHAGRRLCRPGTSPIMNAWHERGVRLSGGSVMGMVYAEIELINGFDLLKAEAGELPENKVRRMPVRMLVDSGCGTLAINENIRTQLGLRKREERTMQMADESVVTLEVVGPVEIRFENRESCLNAVVLPGDAEPLLGAIPMQDMDVLIDPHRHRLIVNPEHPILAGGLLK